MTFCFRFCKPSSPPVTGLSRLSSLGRDREGLGLRELGRDGEGKLPESKRFRLRFDYFLIWPIASRDNVVS